MFCVRCSVAVATCAVVCLPMLAFAAPASAADCDIAILNGRVMDPETKFDGVRNVCIKGDRIASITEDKITGKETIDASAHVVAPGFIDTHTHSSNKFNIKMGIVRANSFTLPKCQNRISQPLIFLHFSGSI
jgi:hypothetical protein